MLLHLKHNTKAEEGTKRHPATAAASIPLRSENLSQQNDLGGGGGGAL
jgi:hypothetical protein